MSSNEIISKLVEMGGNEWQKGNYHRVYFNGFAERLGLSVERYNSGNICSATQHGESISNSEAKRILGRLSRFKVYYDVPSGKMLTQNDTRWGVNDREKAEIVDSIRLQAATVGVTL